LNPALGILRKQALGLQGDLSGEAIGGRGREAEPEAPRSEPVQGGTGGHSLAQKSRCFQIPLLSSLPEADLRNTREGNGLDSFHQVLVPPGQEAPGLLVAADQFELGQRPVDLTGKYQGPQVISPA
jgi:hypothetical protein